MKTPLILVFGILSGVVLNAQDQNPFATPKETPNSQEVASQPTPLDSLEFNGIMVMDGKTRISVTDTRTSQSYWLTKEEVAEDGLRVTVIDRQKETIVVSRNGQTRQLTMKEVAITPLKVTNIPTPPPNVPVSNNNRQNARRNDQPRESDEEVQARMRKVAEEIRRRRAERRERLEARQNNQ